MDSSLAKASVYTDFNGLAELRAEAVHRSDAGTLRKVAAQFEAIFLNMMMKSMRETGVGDDLFGSSQEELYRDMSDQQLSVDLASRGGIGLADVMVRQLSRQAGPVENGVPGVIRDDTRLVMRRYPGTTRSGTRLPVQAGPDAGSSSVDAQQRQTSTFATPRDFVQGVWDYASIAADMLGVSTEVVVAQAALETGWGKRIMSHLGGKSSNNLFGIKADERWSGDKAYVPTTEFRHGRMVREYAAFRAYDSLEEGFRDYVNFVSSGKRYQGALDAASNPEQYVRELHKAGYATDPEYSDKITRIMNSSKFRGIVSELGSPL